MKTNKPKQENDIAEVRTTFLDRLSNKIAEKRAEFCTALFAKAELASRFYKK